MKESSVGQMYTRIGSSIDNCTQESESSIGYFYTTRIEEQYRTVLHENWEEISDSCTRESGVVSDSCTRESESIIGQFYTRIGKKYRTVLHENRRALSDSFTRESGRNIGQLYTRIGSSVGQLYTRIGEVSDIHTCNINIAEILPTCVNKSCIALQPAMQLSQALAYDSRRD
ncbi:hypothetical protein J6590_062595 [Homalodisca vitripennis]|nr:hypothetical protein J6590_062595 [Homalodisca vitripennis]